MPDRFWNPRERWPEFDPLDHFNARADVEGLESLLAECESHNESGLCTAVEVGTWAGATARLIAERGWRVFCVDTWQGNPADRLGPIAASLGADAVFRTFLKNCGPNLYRRIFPLRGTSAEMGSTWPADFKADLVFLDGDHRYKYVRQDISLWRRALKPGGVLCGHDYKCFEGVTAAADEAGVEGVVGESVWWRRV